MTLHFKLSDIKSERERTTCSKPECKNQFCVRHHKGSERTFVTNFWRKRRSPRYRAFKARYEEFNEADLVRICTDHHEEIHILYWNVILPDIKGKGYTPLEDYSWDQALELMAKLRVECDKWLKLKTPGVKSRRWTGKAFKPKREK